MELMHGKSLPGKSPLQLLAFAPQKIPYGFVPGEKLHLHFPGSRINVHLNPDRPQGGRMHPKRNLSTPMSCTINNL
jgi:hypothetical protein